MAYSQKRVHTMTPFLRCSAALLYLLSLLQRGATQFTSEPRWGQAVAVVNNQIFVHGGKTEAFNEYSYTAAPTSNDLFLLDLTTSFDASSPSWQYISGSANSSSPQGPILAWHTISAYNTSQLLLFGGDGGPNSPIVLPNQSDSAEILGIGASATPSWTSENEGWADEPSRRIHHATASFGGRVFLIGGEKDDGSGLGYSDHYVFDPSVPSFTQLSTSNAPPDIYGHACVVLSDGRLLVFGGYSQSESQLLPMTTIWSLDMTQNTPEWSTLDVSGENVPPGRRAFASVWTEGEKVLIHGGSDAEFQTSFSDGWLLDTTTNPMTWANLTGLADLGARRDHFAVQVGSQIIFGFGYETNGPAPVTLSIYDLSQDAFVTQFSPQDSPSQTTLPVPSGTSGSSPGNSQGSGSHSSGGSGAQSTSSPNPSASDPGSSSGSGSLDKHKQQVSIAIALGSVFGALALVAIGFAYVVYVHKRSHADEQFQIITDEDFGPPPTPHNRSTFGRVESYLPWLTSDRAEKPRMSDPKGKETWTMFGLGRRRENNAGANRIDMLANEDSSMYGTTFVRRADTGSSKSWYSIHMSGTGHERLGSGGSTRKTLAQLFNGSLNSLRSVGAVFGSVTGVRRVTSIAGNIGHGNRSDYSLPFDPFEDNEGLLLRDRDVGYEIAASEGPSYTNQMTGSGLAIATRLHSDRRNEGSGSSRYSDPFKDQDEREVLFNASATDMRTPTTSDPSPRAENVNFYVNDSSSQSTDSQSSLSRRLPPLLTVPSHDGSDPSPSSSSSAGGYANSSSSSLKPRTTSIITASSPTQPMKRSNSWWTRFRHPSFRESLYETARSPTQATFDFRDPNPPPGRLGPIQETSTSTTDGPESPEIDRGRTKKKFYSTSGGQEKSTTSLKTNRTADSEAIERMAGLIDVALREATGSSIEYTSSSPGRSPERATIYSSAGSETQSQYCRYPSSSSDDMNLAIAPILVNSFNESREIVESPIEETSTFPLNTSIVSIDSEQSECATPTARTPRSKRPTSVGAVATRVAEYERRMTQEMAPSTTSKVHPNASRKGTSVKYGLVQKPELFIANPDKRASTSSDS